MEELKRKKQLELQQMMKVKPPFPQAEIENNSKGGATVTHDTSSPTDAKSNRILINSNEFSTI